jgi:hypothetical protein
LASACAVDGHKWLYPVCFRVFDSETTENWIWFMSHLREAIGSPRGLTICTDARQTVMVVTEPTNYTKLSKKIIHQADDLTNLSPYNPVVHEITTDFKPTYISAKIIISLAITITNYIKVHIADTSEFKHSYYKPSSNKSSGII